MEGKLAMVSNTPNISSQNYIQPNLYQNNIDTAASSMPIKINGIQQPQRDSVNFTTMQKDDKNFIQNNWRKMLLGAVAIGAGVILTKGYRSHQMTKSLNQIEQRFLKLQENISEVQKTFKDVFLRSDISERETLELLNRYKEIEKLGVTGTKEDYIQAVFNEAKRNFGFADCNFKLVLEKGQVTKNGKTMGGAGQTCNRIIVDPHARTESIQGIVHHEIRHMKQNYYAVNYNPQEYKYALRRDETIGLTKKELDEVLDSSLDDIGEIFHLKTFSKNNIPKEQMQYAKQCLEGYKTYIDGHTDFNAYYNNFMEVDARQAGGLIDKLFNGAVLGGNK